MRKARFSEEQTTYVLEQVESGRPVGEVCRQVVVSCAHLPCDFTSGKAPELSPFSLIFLPLVADKDREPSAQEEIPMVINCIQCNIDYQLDGVFLQEAKKGVQICCGKCGCSFDVKITPPSSQDDEATVQLNSQSAILDDEREPLKGDG